MTERLMRRPGPDHPITITPGSGRVVVKLDGKIIADSRRALTLRESSYPAVQYIPRADVDMALLERTSHAAYCPYKGECSYFSVPSAGERLTNAIWSYEAPYTFVSAIKEYLAFYPDRFEISESAV